MRKVNPVILTFIRHYLPGHEAGGPVRSIANLVDCLGKEFDFRIVTLDRDILDKRPYPGVKVDAWNSVGKAQVYYASRKSLTLLGIARILKETKHDVLYLNSFFGTAFSALPLLARRAGVASGPPIVLAPRGGFSEGALALKRWKKAPFTAAMRAFGLCRNVIWQASSHHEADDIRRVIGENATIEIAPDVSAWTDAHKGERSKGRIAEAPLNIVFVSRITPKKNLDFALRVLKRVRVPVRFTIAGPINDEKYWLRCKAVIESLPPHVIVKTIGSVAHGAVSRLMAENDLFFLPTRGENYGHVVAEALAVGTPVLLSDTTPWRCLQEAGVGWDLSLEHETPFVEAVEAATAKGECEYAEWRKVVAGYAKQRLTDQSIVDANRRLLRNESG